MQRSFARRFSIYCSHQCSRSYELQFARRTYTAIPEKEYKEVNNDMFSVEGNKSFFRTLFEYGGYGTAMTGVYSFSMIEMINHFTILGPYSITPALLCGSLFGLFLGSIRGTVIGIGNNLIAQRRLTDIVSRAIKQVGVEELRLDEASEGEITALIEKVYARFPWTHQQTLGSMIKRSLAFALLPNVEQVIQGIHREIQFNKLRKIKAGNMEQLTCGVVNGLVQAQVDRVDTLLLVGGWALLIIGSIGLFGALYTTKKSFMWMVVKKEIFDEKKDETMAKVSEMVPYEYIEEKKEKLHDMMDQLPSFKRNENAEDSPDTHKKSLKDFIKEKANKYISKDKEQTKDGSEDERKEEKEEKDN